jgi:hypothetical protein
MLESPGCEGRGWRGCGRIRTRPARSWETQLEFELLLVRALFSGDESSRGMTLIFRL